MANARAQESEPATAGESGQREAGPSSAERVRNILEAESIGGLGLTSYGFLSETGAVLSALIGAGTAGEASELFVKARSLIDAAEADGTWGIRFSNGISPESYLLNRLITGAPDNAPSVAHADFVLTMLRAPDDPTLFVDRMRIGMAIASVADDMTFAPAKDAVQAALAGLEAGLSQENVALAAPGYHAFFRQIATDKDELVELLDALRREAAPATDPKRSEIVREMLIAGQCRLARFSSNTPGGAGLEAQSEHCRERIASTGLALGARMLVAETVLYETGDVLAFSAHTAGWEAMTAAMARGAVIPEQALAMLRHADAQRAAPEFGIQLVHLSAAWAERLRQILAGNDNPQQAAIALLHQLIDLNTQAGNSEQLGQLVSVPVPRPDLGWFMTMLEYADPEAAAGFFLRFGPELELRSGNSNLAKCVHSEALEMTRLPMVAAELEDDAQRWLLRVLVAALPDEPLTSTASNRTFRARERRLEKLAAARAAVDFDGIPEVEIAALSWIAEEFDATRSIADAYARIGEAIAPSSFFNIPAAPGVDGQRRIVTAWLRHSLDDGPAAFATFLAGLNVPGRPGRDNFEAIMTVGALASGLQQTFDDESADWPADIRRRNLMLFRSILARPELDNFNSQFLGRHVAAGLIRHAVEGQGGEFDIAWDALDSSRREIILRGDNGFFPWFGSMLRAAAEGRRLDAAAMEAATRGIHDSIVYKAMCEETFSGPKTFFQDALSAGIATEELLCRVGPDLIKSNPRNGYAAEELAGIQEKQGQTDAALESWDSAIVSAPSSSKRRYTRAFLAKAGLLERDGRFVEALAALKELDSDRLDNSEKTTFQNTLKELRILALSDKRTASEMLQFAANGLTLLPNSIQGRLSAAAVFRALRLKAEAAGNDRQAWAFGFLAAHTLRQLERDEKASTGGRADSALRGFNAMHVGLGKPGGTLTLVPKGADWRFTNTPPPATWIQPDFVDAAWQSGPAPLGYGDSAVRTFVDFGDNRKQKPSVTYFRARFLLPENEAITRISFNMRRDDAAIVYLNGNEIRRDNLPDGVLDAVTLATGKTSGSDESRYFPGPFSPSRLQVGENTLAIAVHQYDQGSSDLIFDVELVANDLGVDTAMGAVSRGELQDVLGPLWRQVPASIRDTIR